jgi:hypothetical protein
MTQLRFLSNKTAIVSAKNCTCKNYIAYAMLHAKLLTLKNWKVGFGTLPLPALHSSVACPPSTPSNFPGPSVMVGGTNQRQE